MLALHSLLRYVVLILLLIAIFKAFAGWFGKKEFTKGDEKTGLLLMIFAHVQLLLGLFLYFTTPMMKALPGMAESMKDPVMRFWKVEHITGMIVAIVLITLGRSLSKRATDQLVKHKRSAIFYALGLLLIIYTIPWEMRGWNPF